MTDTPQNPVKWLWERLSELLPVQDYLDLQIGFQEQQRRYQRASLLRHTRRELALFEHNLQGCHLSRRDSYLKKIAHRKERIAELEAELDAEQN